jgi:hypothetical protein
MIESRAKLVEFVRGELVGPFRTIAKSKEVILIENKFQRGLDEQGLIHWKDGTQEQEIVYYKGESPIQNYAIGLLHSLADSQNVSEMAASEFDEKSEDEQKELQRKKSEDEKKELQQSEYSRIKADASVGIDEGDSDDLNLSNIDARAPSNMAISIFASFKDGGKININLPKHVKFEWQESEAPFEVNGRYSKCSQIFKDAQGTNKESDAWKRHSSVKDNCIVSIDSKEFIHEKKIVVSKEKLIAEDCSLDLRLEIYPRKFGSNWLLTVVIRNETKSKGNKVEGTLFQTYFDLSISNGEFIPYPESNSFKEHEDKDDLSLKLLYRDSAIWAIGHGCAAGWDKSAKWPSTIYLDVFPVAELPSMTPDISDRDNKHITLTMRECANISDDKNDETWSGLKMIISEFEYWVNSKKVEMQSLDAHLKGIASEHISKCLLCLDRMKTGLALLASDKNVRDSFKLANIAMLLQQISSKQMTHRPLVWNGLDDVSPSGNRVSPWEIFTKGKESGFIGKWRAFQIAFLLMSLRGVTEDDSNSDIIDDRELVDLIWFPTGGGKTEAYLAAASYYMFHQRMLIDKSDTLRRDGVNVFMRYTLRMLTTQQFQRAASLICAMEFLRRKSLEGSLVTGRTIKGKRFSLGLWLGSAACPNTMKDAKEKFKEFKKSDDSSSLGNPFVLTECPWCKSQIGKAAKSEKPKSIKKDTDWNNVKVKGVGTFNNGDSTDLLLQCSDVFCDFGGRRAENWLPIEVVDERIYKYPPSMYIATADKFAMLAYRPAAGSLFGRKIDNDNVIQQYKPPGLIIQDELHLISGPLGTMYGIYESVFENLCSYKSITGQTIKPKIIASTATIKGAEQQIFNLYNRENLQLFPSPALDMGDSFFGRYAKNENGSLKKGRMYIGLLAEFGSVQTTQVRCFSSLIFHAATLSEEKRDPWWSLLCFYNSIRELSGGRTLFDSDIPARLKYLYSKVNAPVNTRRYANKVYELTSRLSQSKLVELMDILNKKYKSSGKNDTADACLASSIIEVGVDIDRLSLMSVIGQPKNTAQYIQVTGRVGRKWEERPGLITTIYNPSKSRDRSHYEQFNSYHARLYEQVEATSVTPFSESAIKRALPGVVLAWVRQNTGTDIRNKSEYETIIRQCERLILARCQSIMKNDISSMKRAIKTINIIIDDLILKWNKNPQEWENFPPSTDEEYLMLWPGQFYSEPQKKKGVYVPSSMRQVDSSSLLEICEDY